MAKIELDVAAVNIAILSVTRVNGGGHLLPRVAGRDLRLALEALAHVAGVSEFVPMASVSDADLVTLYNVGLRSPVSTAQIAQRINAKYDILHADAGKPIDLPPAPPSGPAPDLSDYVKLEYFETWYNSMQEAFDVAAEKQVHHAKEHIDNAVREAVRGLTPLLLEVKTPDKPDVTAMGQVHYALPRIIRALGAGLNVYLHGPAGSGKTTAGQQCAEAFGVAFYTAAKVESEYLLLGFKDARGEVVRTQFRDAYEHGGVFLFDELDASSPSAVVALNMALANGICPFPDGNVKRHDKFYCIAAGNTVLTGASRMYSGRSQLDAASVDRFYFVEFGYDEALESALASNSDWCRHVQAIRKHIADKGLDHLVTPRATFDGCKALQAGDTWEEAEMACVFKGLDKYTIEQIRDAVKPNSEPEILPASAGAGAKNALIDQYTQRSKDRKVR